MALRSALRRSIVAASLSIGFAPWMAMAIPRQPEQSQAPAPDNSAANKDQPDTADKQGNGTQDRQIASRIRKAIVSDKSLSTYAKNVKVIVRSGSVTLRGPVRSGDEKKKIGDYANQAVGSSGSVDNELTIQPS